MQYKLTDNRCMSRFVWRFLVKPVKIFIKNKMENILNENANANPKYLDHLYCHTNDSKTVMRTNHKYNNNVNKTMNAADAELVLKENKQLKSMLILHLDLIQQQADELSGKERELMTRTEECDNLRAFNAQLEAKVVDLQRQLQRQIKRAVVKRTFLPPPPLAKIQCHNDNITNVTLPAKIVRVSNTDPATAIATMTNANNAKINNSNVNLLTKCKTTAALTTPIAATSKLPALEKIEVKYEHNIHTRKNVEKDNSNLNSEKVGENHAVAIKVEPNVKEQQDIKDLHIKTTTVGERNAREGPEITIKLEPDLKLDAKPKTASEINFCSNIHSSTTCSSPCSTTTVRTSITSSSPNSSKRRRLWQASDFDTDEDSMTSYDSLLDIETNSNTCATSLPCESCDSSIDSCQESDCSMSSSCSSKSSSASGSDTPSSKHNFMYHIVTSPYLSRPWQEEELDGELEEDEAEALRAAEPKLEIPKWTEHEITPLYSIEGTEDLTDDTFSKRHSKLELDEKRRKKWDVQQIREQRRIEKLRRRHCKDELTQGPIIQSFFPLAEELETICFVETLPVQAFGEPIPKLPNNGEGFRLPWIVESPGRTVRKPKDMQKEENTSKNETDIEIENSEYNENKENENETKSENKENKQELEENTTINAKDEEIEITKKDEENEMENIETINDDTNDETKHNDVNNEDEQQEKCSNTTIREAISLDDDNSNSSNIDDSCDNNSKMDSPFRFAAVAGSCYHSPVIMLAKHSKQCASRTQMRKRLRYSSYLFLTKRRRQLSMSTIAQTTNNANIPVTTVNNTNDIATNTGITTSPTTKVTVDINTTPISSTEIMTTISSTTTTITATTTTAANNIGKLDKLNEQKSSIAIKTRSMQPSTRKITRALITAQNKAIGLPDKPKTMVDKETVDIALTSTTSITKVTSAVRTNVSSNVTAASTNITTSTVTCVAPIATASVVKPTTRSFEKRAIDDKSTTKSLTATIETAATAATASTAAATATTTTTVNTTRSKLRAFRGATPTSSINNSNSCTSVTTTLASIEEKTKTK